MSELAKEVDGSVSPSYQRITELVQNKALALTFIFGPPRGGTTAAERWMFESFGYDGNVNQPGLMARDEVYCNLNIYKCICSLYTVDVL